MGDALGGLNGLALPLAHICVARPFCFDLRGFRF